jgi:hypothetical protein
MFLRCARDEPEKYRLMELHMRCFIARGEPGAGATVIGITVVESNTEPGFSLEVMHLHHPAWTEEDSAIAAETKHRTGYVADPVFTRSHEDEYPQQRHDCPCLHFLLGAVKRRLRLGNHHYDKDFK